MMSLVTDTIPSRRVVMPPQEPRTVSKILLSDPEAELLARKAITGIFRDVIKALQRINES